MSAAGFALHDAVLPSRACDALLRALSRAPRTRGGARHLMRIPAVAAVARRTGLLDLARAWVGPDAVPYRATLFDKGPNRNWKIYWHQDTALPLSTRTIDTGWGPSSVKDGIVYSHAPTHALERIVALRIHLDASTQENGPLRVIPGSHRQGVLGDESVFALARAVGTVELLAERGGVVAMSPLLVHASSKSTTQLPRRVLHIEYAASLRVGSSTLALA